ncbi:hypothetical protein EP073_05615 [Geovibrio thiophilus]|uniref:Ferrous iron transport protein A n=1 Tax=Geovibrio thiophilus TaxID=139438 RepID=A0A410JXQ7_9BACT|nr:hypothetical protein [Geovibrio thiophilus]QAR32899.1 hypothetical protein EP073_05615 [Geovibrio thiophilus]
MLNLQNAESGRCYIIKSSPQGDSAQKLASLGLYKGSAVTKLDLDDIKYPTVKIDTKNGVRVLSGQLAKHITVRAGSGEPKPFYEVSPSSTVITYSVGKSDKNAARLAMLGVKERMKVKIIKNLPPMEYVITVNHKNRVRISEAVAAMIVGDTVNRKDFQLTFSPKGTEFRVTGIAAGQKITAFLSGVEIGIGSVIIMEGIESGKRVDLDAEQEIVLYTHEGLIITMSSKTASMIEVEQG